MDTTGKYVQYIGRICKTQQRLNLAFQTTLCSSGVPAKYCTYRSFLDNVFSLSSEHFLNGIEPVLSMYMYSTVLHVATVSVPRKRKGEPCHASPLTSPSSCTEHPAMYSTVHYSTVYGTPSPPVLRGNWDKRSGRI